MEIKFNKDDKTIEIFATTPIDSFDLGRIVSKMQDAGIVTKIEELDKSVSLKIKIKE